MERKEKERLISKYSLARHIADKSIFKYEIFCQSVQLALQQIQEIEITILKRKQQVKIEDILIDIVFMYLIEAKYVSVVFRKRSEKHFKSFLKGIFIQKHLFNEVGPRGIYARHKPKIDPLVDKDIDQFNNVISDIIQTSAKLGERKYIQTPQSPSSLEEFDKGTGNWSTLLENKTLRPYQENWERYTKDSPNMARGFPYEGGSDYISVAILKSAFSKYSEYKHFINSQLLLLNNEIMLMLFSDDYYDSIDRELTSDITLSKGTIVEKNLDKLIELDNSNESFVIDYSNFINQCSVEVEKIIWVSLYGSKMHMTGGRYGSDITQISESGIIQGVDTDDKHELQNYWWARFPNPETGLPFANKFLLFDHFKQIYSYLQSKGIDEAISQIQK